jgi:hypothetical protein
MQSYRTTPEADERHPPFIDCVMPLANQTHLETILSEARLKEFYSNVAMHKGKRYFQTYPGSG